MAKKEFDFGFEAEGRKLEMIPAVERVKKDILDARSLAIIALRNIVYRRRYGKNTSKEMAYFQAAVVNLYMELKEKFSKKHRIRKVLDKAIRENDKLSFNELCNMLDYMIKKMEDLKLTKIEFKRPPADRAIF